MDPLLKKNHATGDNLANFHCKLVVISTGNLVF